jgi:TRAP-type C4-dicarboxylate transport system substrate-binding protein
MSKISIRFGGYQNPDSIHNQSAIFFGQKLKEHFKDQIDFELIGNVMNHGRMSGDLPQMVSSGELTCCYISTVRFTEWVPEVAIIDLPFIVKDRQTIQNSFRNHFGNHLKKRFLNASPFHLMGIWDNGFRHITNNIRSIHTPKDCEGLNIRTQMSQIHVDSLRSMGFNPIPIDVKDFIAQINTGRFNAQDNPLTNTYNFGVHNYHRFITLTGHFFGGTAFICNRQIYDSWTKDFQDAFDEISKLATEFQWQLATKEDELMIHKLSMQDVIINEISADQKQIFMQSVEPVIHKYRQSFNPEIFAMLEEN